MLEQSASFFLFFNLKRAFFFSPGGEQNPNLANMQRLQSIPKEVINAFIDSFSLSLFLSSFIHLLIDASIFTENFNSPHQICAFKQWVVFLCLFSVYSR